MSHFRESLESIVVSANQMSQIEGRIFEAGMPVAALMEKAAGIVATRIQQLYPFQKVSIGVLVGPGHNGGDALVVARELHLQGYSISIYQPFSKLKELTLQHARYTNSLGIPHHQTIQALQECELIIDGLFGFGLERSLTSDLADAVNLLNQWQKPVISIDIPSGIHTDTGAVLGAAVKATHTLCLGLWKRAIFQDTALEYIGKAERLDFGIPHSDVWAILGQNPLIQQITPTLARSFLPLPRPLVTHKYKQGHLLLICGSSRYAGGAILAGLGARGSGVGMLSIAVPTSLKPLLVSHLPEALIIDCPETETGAIAQLPSLSQYDIIACGPGLTQDAETIIEQVLQSEQPLVLDADGLNILAKLGISKISTRQNPTILTPHLGEFKRLFPSIENLDRISAVSEAARQSGAIVLFKGARTAIAHPDGKIWLIPQSTPALARGGSGDILTGLLGGLLAQSKQPVDKTVAIAAWLHSQAGIKAAKDKTELGVDGITLAQYINLAVSELL
ncbi:bifunctional ADP-dependent NAD(P)H-hydrate dehydratase/NAD(P)H-hydrate epimerase [Aphanothece hegewaldii CCALA 016]|uniref:Bifunctional NAD(P)H-hydrate repair enzyme n=1 Tax=Aphanothece hegewaldii CCALA 016 TaxID=2107694 RepID=A0A2T1M1K4_9CHRO|nr:NAD(P)H-hydrate dehydratase [Aphanothece hegewaldii]PSF38581.1 bifunctional ADP-dependent NAD(P)H-hydrate dehydratase/NAD(P)H-hydrate epimerase [Aphanothece hegewaldii CCALA 016]